jgi:hypothetical protein
MATCMGRADRSVTLCDSDKLRRLGTQSCPFIAIIGLQGFFPLKGQNAVGVGALEVPTSERKRLAVL